MPSKVGERLKSPVRRILGGLGMRIIRVDRTFGIDPILDMLTHYKDRSYRTVVDVGANVGTFTVKAAKQLPSARVLAFEPIRGTFDELVANTAGLRNVETFRLAVGDREGEATVFLQDHPEWNSLAAAVNCPRPGARAEVVGVKRLDSMFEEGLFKSIDLLKIDTEGFEVNVLGGAKSMLNAGVIGFILCEVAFDRDDKGHGNFFEIYDLLSRSNFRLFAFYDQTIVPRVRQAGYCNALFVSTSLD